MPSIGKWKFCLYVNLWNADLIVRAWGLLAFFYVRVFSIYRLMLSVYMDYQEEANYVAQMNIHYTVFYCVMIATGTYTTNSVMSSVSNIHYTRRSQFRYWTFQANETPVIIHRIICRTWNPKLLNKVNTNSRLCTDEKYMNELFISRK